jgi:hypothetical protein
MIFVLLKAKFKTKFATNLKTKNRREARSLFSTEKRLKNRGISLHTTFPGFMSVAYFVTDQSKYTENF